MNEDLEAARFVEIAKRVDPAAERPLSAQIFLALSGAIESRILKKGERLPPERELMKIFGVSRGTLRTALLELIAQDYLSATQGRGTFVHEAPKERPLRILALESFQTELAPGPSLHYQWIDRAARGVGAQVYYRYTPAVEELVEALQTPPESYDGILIFRAVPEWSRSISQMADALFEQCPIPVLIVGRPIEKGGVETVTWDYEDAAYRATSDLIRQGHKRVGFVGGKPVPGHSFEAFYHGYLKALKEAGLRPRAKETFFREGPLGVDNETSNRELAKFLRDRAFDAVLVSLIADPFEKACAMERIVIPRDLDVRLVGEEHSFRTGQPWWQGYGEPSESVVAKGFELLAAACRGECPRGQRLWVAPSEWLP